MTEGNVKLKPSIGLKIELSKENTNLLKTLLAQANSNIKGSVLTHTKLCNWLLAQHNPNLSDDEIQGLNSEFHSERVFVKWMYEEMTRAELAGEPVPTIEELKARIPAVKTRKPSGRKPRKSKKVSEPKNGSSESPLTPEDSGANTPPPFSEKTSTGGEI